MQDRCCPRVNKSGPQALLESSCDNSWKKFWVEKFIDWIIDESLLDSLRELKFEQSSSVKTEKSTD